MFSERLLGIVGGPSITRSDKDYKRGIFTAAGPVAGSGAAGAMDFINACKAAAAFESLGTYQRQWLHLVCGIPLAYRRQRIHAREARRIACRARIRRTGGAG